MAEIVEELFNEFPEFNKNPGKLKEALNCLIDSKPNIKISTTFKKNLKSRIDNIISLKCKRKFNFFHIFASTFAFFIFLLGIFTIYIDINVLNKTGIEERIMISDLLVPYSELEKEIEFLDGSDEIESIPLEKYTGTILESFEDYCLRNLGKIVETNYGKTCSMDGTECSEVDYNMGICSSYYTE